jgi:hypothetical protein
MNEAGVRQFTTWGDTDEGRHILIAVARYLAAHSPTERAALQTADIARRLSRAVSCISKVEAGTATQSIGTVAVFGATDKPGLYPVLVKWHPGCPSASYLRHRPAMLCHLRHLVREFGREF